MGGPGAIGADVMNDMNIYFFFSCTRCGMLLWMMIDTHTFVFVSSLVFDICL